MAYFPPGLQASTLLELMTIKAFHSKLLRLSNLGTAIGFLIKKGLLTDVPATFVFVARKVHRQWLNPAHCLLATLEGPGGVGVMLMSLNFLTMEHLQQPPPKEQLYTDLVDSFGGLIHALDLVLKLQAKKPWVLLLTAGQRIGRLVSSLISMWLLIWIIQARKCFICCLQVLDQGCTKVLWRGRHHSLPMISGSALLLEPTRKNF